MEHVFFFSSKNVGLRWCLARFPTDKAIVKPIIVGGSTAQRLYHFTIDAGPSIGTISATGAGSTLPPRCEMSRIERPAPPRSTGVTLLPPLGAWVGTEDS
ncbi:hypothetical protein PAXRUDRAFT_821051 [Paxillus rubicundulus Ve08.2h10]|uniref:Uncharacterized protein n=1 Tax=Paxillus rubicundulus Ve08.2h10 TaxID=930991 RepID=A0A0D0DYU1_9AGAM|nr:hypothetical protein PAXRUDRAFT_821051 [Paxillus rubicundulus Ve08.2h10]